LFAEKATSPKKERRIKKKKKILLPTFFRSFVLSSVSDFYFSVSLVSAPQPMRLGQAS
jgi:hypothetical protein